MMIQAAVSLLLLALPGIGDEVSFPTPDGGVVCADQFGDGPRGVVLAPGGRYTKESWTVEAGHLAATGFRVLAIDFRGKGRSRGGPRADPQGDDLYLDVLAAVRYLRQTGASSVSVVGGSLGGWAAARAAIEAPGEIERLVLLAAASVEEPEKLVGRKLFVTTRHDVNGRGLPRLEAIRRQYERSPDPKELLVLDGAAHAQLIFSTAQGGLLLQKIVRFLQAP